MLRPFHRIENHSKQCGQGHTKSYWSLSQLPRSKASPPGCVRQDWSQLLLLKKIPNQQKIPQTSLFFFFHRHLLWLKTSGWPSLSFQKEIRWWHLLEFWALRYLDHSSLQLTPIILVLLNTHVHFMTVTKSALSTDPYIPAFHLPFWIWLLLGTTGRYKFPRASGILTAFKLPKTVHTTVSMGQDPSRRLPRLFTKQICHPLNLEPWDS